LACTKKKIIFYINFFFYVTSVCILKPELFQDESLHCRCKIFENSNASSLKNRKS
jgi:hypothetical protein